MTIYFTSDLHFGHEKLRTVFCPDRAARWPTAEAMNQGIIDAINERVGEKDELWHLGDLSFTKDAVTESLLRKINCRTVNSIPGNHDSVTRLDAMFERLNKEAGFEKFWLGNPREEIVIEKQSIILDHFLLEVWNKSHYGSWHLHGHTHGAVPSRGKRVDVGFDSKFIDGKGLKVFSFEEIRDYMARQEIWDPAHSSM